MDTFKTLEIPSLVIGIDDRKFRLSTPTWDAFSTFTTRHDTFMAACRVVTDAPSPEADQDAKKAGNELLRFVLRHDAEGRPNQVTDEWLEAAIWSHLFRADEILTHQIAVSVPRGVFARTMLAVRNRAAETKPAPPVETEEVASV